MCKQHKPMEVIAGDKAQPNYSNPDMMELKYCYECARQVPLVLWGLKTVPIKEEK